MECNKEEAIRAKEIAEKKMQNSDFVGARKIALKAQQLFPDLENISQLLTVCEVHCSAQNKICGSEMDWYGILQIERLADEGTIKKQYRKLALLLHPDKNKFAGAESAFKLIGEANRVLSDPGKRSLHDMKCRVPVRPVAPKPPPHQVNRNSFVRKPYNQNNFPSVANPQFTGLNPHQQMQSGSHNGRETFWTCCPFCCMRYQYYKDIVNRTLRCQSCDKPFIAYDLGGQSVPPGSNWSQPVFAHQKGVPSPAPFQVGSQSAGRNPPSGMGFQGSFTNRSAESESVSKAGSTAEVVGSKRKRKGNGHVDVGSGKEGVRMSTSDAAKHREAGTSRHTRRKRGRKLVVESSESSKSTSSDDIEDVVIQENGFDYAGQNGGQHCRRSSRQKQFVYYNENVSDDEDFVSPPKRSKGSGLSSVSEEGIKEAAQSCGISKMDNSTDSATVADGGKEKVKQKASVPLEEGSQKKKRKAGEGRVNGTEAATEDHSDEKSKVDDKYELNPNNTPEILEYPDPDFSDFDKDKAEDRFAVDQVWAIYDTIDIMPRFYARVRKVFTPEFKLRITWFEPHPDDEGEIDWVNKELPVACGKFKYGVSEETTDRLMFSHQVYYEKGIGRGSYVIYPRKGETWALFKNWDISWSSDPENHKQFKFEFVEVLSDFVQDYGIGVAYLGKVKGFVSLFQQTTRNGIVSFRIPPGELFRFSHRVPSFRMTGTEREGVPKGSLELDPVSLPADIDDCGDPGDTKTQNESMDAEVKSSCSKAPENNVKPMVGSKTIETPTKHENIDIERETLKLRKSPRESNGTHKNHSRVNASQCMTREETDKNIGGSKDECHGNLNKSGGSASCQADERISTPKKHEKTDLEREALKLRRSPREFNGKKHGQVNASQGLTRDEIDKHLDGSKDENHGSLTQSRGSASSRLADEEMHLNGKDRSSNSFTKSSTASPSTSLGHRTPEANYYNFNEDKSEEKFQPGQIWALYSDRERLPKNYAQVKKIESGPDFRLHVALLEACSEPKDIIRPVCCGTFKLKNGKTKVFCRTAFSHQLIVKSIGKNRFEIYPRKGEVWAIYKNWNTESTSLDLENCEYDMVEVLEDNDLCTKVSLLSRVNGFKSVFKAPRRQRSNIGIMDIPRVELSRFSHQIPAIQHTGEKDIRLSGCWELDPSSIPGIVICLD
ncbi:hypothetical protein L1049_021077 [Liquidambar formosana]|uniref:J domain-containing protein n=1 Tax=Liquidambar formosana TaxID=63359 RepID=A0AAP0X7Y8_LIQFO